MMSPTTLSEESNRELYKEIYVKADRIIERLLLVMYLFGFFIAFFYDTWFVLICERAHFLAINNDYTQNGGVFAECNPKCCSRR